MKLFIYLEKTIAVAFGIVLFLITLRGSNDLFGISKFADKIYFTDELNFKRNILAPTYKCGEIDVDDAKEILADYQQEHWFRHSIAVVIILLNGICSLALSIFTIMQLYEKYRLLRFRERLFVE
ncbi:MAG: hypothetical protein P9M03_01045 [Candidatus Theseobacter exili]|nr:hypothetical protein [Candidatus Theseobacter exili]